MCIRDRLYREVEQAGGVTSITVSGKPVGSSTYYYEDGQDESSKYVTDETIQELLRLEHVKLSLIHI